MIQYIDLGGQERPMKFGYFAFKAICTKLKIKLTELDRISEAIENIAIVAYYGLKSGAKAENISQEFTLQNVEEWIDNEGFGSIAKIMEALAESQASENKNNDKVTAVGKKKPKK